MTEPTSSAKRYFQRDDLTPTAPPLLVLAVAWLWLDRLHAAGWIYGVVFTLLAILTVAEIVHLVRYVVCDSKALTAADVDRRLSALEGKRP